MEIAGHPIRVFFRSRVSSTEIIHYYCTMGERFRYEVRGRSWEFLWQVTSQNLLEYLFSSWIPSV